MKLAMSLLVSSCLVALIGGCGKVEKEHAHSSPPASTSLDCTAVSSSTDICLAYGTNVGSRLRALYDLGERIRAAAAATHDGCARIALSLGGGSPPPSVGGACDLMRRALENKNIAPMHVYGSEEPVCEDTPREGCGGTALPPLSVCKPPEITVPPVAGLANTSEIENALPGLLAAHAQAGSLTGQYIADAKELMDAVNLARQPSSTEPLSDDQSNCLNTIIGDQTTTMSVGMGDLTAAQMAIQDSFIVGPRP